MILFLNYTQISKNKRVFNAKNILLIFTTAMSANTTFVANAGNDRLPTNSNKELLVTFRTKKRITRWQ